MKFSLLNQKIDP